MHDSNLIYYSVSHSESGSQMDLSAFFVKGFHIQFYFHKNEANLNVEVNYSKGFQIQKTSQIQIKV